MTKTLRRAVRRLAPWLVYSAYASALAASLVDALGLLFIAVLVLWLVDVALAWLPPVERQRASRRLPTMLARSLIRSGLFVAGIATILPIDEVWLIAIPLATLAFIQACRALYFNFYIKTVQDSEARYAWRNLEVGERRSGPPEITEPVRSWQPLSGASFILLLDIGMYVGAAISALASSRAWFILGCVLAGASAFAVLVSGYRLRRVWKRESGERARANEAVRAAIAALAPQVIFHFSGPDGYRHVLKNWIAQIDAIPYPHLVIVRERSHLHAAKESTSPIVFLPRDADVESAHLPSVRLVLYPMLTPKNNHLIRMTGVRHCYIGSGDSDDELLVRAGARVFHEIWVPGERHIEQYLALEDGVERDRVRIIGRPQSAPLQPPGEEPVPVDVPTVIYAPTWEGRSGSSNFSTLIEHGEYLVSTFIELGWQVLFAPDVRSGTRRKAGSRVSRRIRRLLEETAGGYTVTHSEALRRAKDAELIVVDVNAGGSDFLSNGRPVFVTNPRQLPAEELRRRFPFVEGAYVLDDIDAHLASRLLHVVGDDPLAAQRAIVAGRLRAADSFDEAVAFVVEGDVHDMTVVQQHDRSSEAASA